MEDALRVAKFTQMMTKIDLNMILEDGEQRRCCRNCLHGYFNEATSVGLCKKNACPVDELYRCEEWNGINQDRLQLPDGSRSS